MFLVTSIPVRARQRRVNARGNARARRLIGARCLQLARHPTGFGQERRNADTRLTRGRGSSPPRPTKSPAIRPLGERELLRCRLGRCGNRVAGRIPSAGEGCLQVLTRFRGRRKGRGIPITDFPGARPVHFARGKVVRLFLYSDQKRVSKPPGWRSSRFGREAAIARSCNRRALEAASRVERTGCGQQWQ
jgi:hypothetical protein